MRVIAFIPARMGASRFPGKPMAKINNIPMIGHCYFRTNSCKDLDQVIKKRAKECAAIIMEPARNTLGCKAFLNSIRKIADKNKCVLIFDEITCAWRNNTSGVHMDLGIYPDLATFGKTMANGVPISALVGKKKNYGRGKKLIYKQYKLD